jgi:hypothetical protein
MLKSYQFKNLTFIRKGLRWNFLIALFLQPLLNCTPTSSNESSTSSYDSVQSLSDSTNSIAADSYIEYDVTGETNIKTGLESFPPLAAIQGLVNRAIQVKDSIRTLRNSYELDDPKDKEIFKPYDAAAYKEIVTYQKRMLKGPRLSGKLPSLLQFPRSISPDDSAHLKLPKVKSSQLFSGGDFCFLGGSPFLYKVDPDEAASFIDPTGKPESRYATNRTENGNFLLTSIYHYKNIPTKVSFGPPLNSYDKGPHEVNGIGSLIHTFIDRLPVLFLTESGLVPAHLMEVTLKLVPENLGCVSDQPFITFACSKNIDNTEILGVFIPFNDAPVTSCKISYGKNSVWTADLNDDGVADIACISNSYLGMASGSMLAKATWFVNLNGNWQVLDRGEDEDCT